MPDLRSAENAVSTRLWAWLNARYSLLQHDRRGDRHLDGQLALGQEAVPLRLYLH
jgi:hypothetical protein